MKGQGRCIEPMLSRQAGFAASSFAVIASLITACTPAHDSGGRQSHTAQDFCAPFLEYFRTDFPIHDVKLSYNGKTSKPDQALDSFEYGLQCRFDPTGNTSPIWASINLRPTRSDDDTKGLAAYLGEMKFTPLTGYEKPIWVRDQHTGQTPLQDKGTIELYTRIDPWVGSIEIIDESAPLAITDAQVAKAANLLISTTEAVGK
ncbi:hypothetical protein [Nocardia aurantia]|uniref:DUF3558 domain-containing protein n=1 Tax=Nocardia aurantia TaxID=2585199 RepID=A0A7K0E191_9NOCA|nr:hypothetical protein [Nocardia aurantia]MQY31547.1 hypothetical protein [Nocardia aurantia]